MNLKLAKTLLRVTGFELATAADSSDLQDAVARFKYRLECLGVAPINIQEFDAASEELRELCAISAAIRKQTTKP